MIHPGRPTSPVAVLGAEVDEWATT